MKNFPTNEFILGAKKRIQKKTVGHAIMSLSMKASINISWFSVNKIIKIETNVLVQNDIKKENMYNLFPDISYSIKKYLKLILFMN